MCSVLTPTHEERLALADTVFESLARNGLDTSRWWTVAHEIVGTVLDDLKDPNLGARPR